MNNCKIKISVTFLISNVLYIKCLFSATCICLCLMMASRKNWNIQCCLDCLSSDGSSLHFNHASVLWSRSFVCLVHIPVKCMSLDALIFQELCTFFQTFSLCIPAYCYVIYVCILIYPNNDVKSKRNLCCLSFLVTQGNFGLFHTELLWFYCSTFWTIKDIL